MLMALKCAASNEISKSVFETDSMHLFQAFNTKDKPLQMHSILDIVSNSMYYNSGVDFKFLSLGGQEIA